MPFSDSIFALLVYTFTVFGFCWGIGGSKLTLPGREYLAMRAQRHNAETGQVLPHAVVSFFLVLIECPACLGFWIGLVFWYSVSQSLYQALAAGFYTAGVNYVIGRATGLIAEP